MFRLITRGGGVTLGGMLLLNNGPGKEKSGDDVQNGNDPNTRSWWDRLNDKLRFSGLSGSTSSKVHKDEKYSETYIRLKKEIEDKITPWDRLKLIFVRSGYEPRSEELSFILYVMETCVITGFLWGGLKEYVKAHNLFTYSDDANKYMNKNEAMVALARALCKAFFKGGLEASPKFGILGGIFATVCTVVSVYRGKSGILEYIAAGAVTTAAMKFNLGIRGMISGCVSGGLAGSILGSILFIVSSTTETNFFDAKYYSYLMSEQKDYSSDRISMKNNLAPCEVYHYEKTKDLPVGFPK